MVKILLLTIILIEINLLYCFIVLPIESLPNNNYITSKSIDNLNNLISKELISPIFTTLKIGKQPKEIPLLIKPKKEFFLINSYKSLNSTVNINKAFYNFTNDFLILFNESSLPNNSLKKCGNYKPPKSVLPMVQQICPFNETLFYYDNINMSEPKKNISFNFNLAKNIKDNITGIIGLNLISEASKETNNNFLKNLITAKVINNSDYYWYFDFDKWNSTKGKLVIGSLPHTDIDFTKNGANFWEMEFYKIYFLNNTNNINNTINFYYETVEFNYDSNVIIGTDKFQRFLSLMLSELIKNGSCKISTFSEFDDEFRSETSTYIYYYCNNNNETIDKLNEVLPTLYFYSSELDYTFEITKDQIIRIINNTIFINIIFNNNVDKARNWILGKPFVFKYRLFFNSYIKKIGFYNIDKYIKKNNDTNNTNNTEVNNHSNDKIIKLIIIIILLVYVCLGFILFTWKNVLNKEKKEVNNDEYKNIEEKKDDIGIINPDDDNNENKNKLIN